MEKNKKKNTTKKTSNNAMKTTTKKTTTKTTKTTTKTNTKPKKKNTNTKKNNINDEIFIETTIKSPKQTYYGPKLTKKKKKTNKEKIKEIPKSILAIIIIFIKNIPNYLKNILKCITIIIIGLGKFILSIFKYIGKFFSLIWNKLKEIDKKDEIKKEKKKEKKKARKEELYKTSTFDTRLFKEDLDKDQLELVSYKDHWNKIGVFLENRGRVLKFDMKKFNKRFKYGTLRDKILILLMLFLIFVFSCVIALVVYVITTAPDPDPERLYKASSTVLYDKNGNEFARLGTENREKVSYDDLPQVLIDAIVATEDSRFFQHNGVDIARFTKAAFGQLLGHDDAGGGSTITMQLSKHTATSNEAHGLEGIIRKFQDIYLAVFVYEKQFTKEQILEFYANIEYLGAAYGVQQASVAYFGKDVSDLNLSEAAMIAGLFQAPYSYNPYSHPVAAEKRRNTVLNLMERHGYISTEEKEAAQAVPIKSLLAGYNGSLNENIRFIDTVVEEVLKRTGMDPYEVSMNIYTTMDPDQQKYINDIQNGVTYKYKNDYSENGIAVIDVDTGALTSVGSGRNKVSARSFNYATEGRRHPGSTAKPVVDYGPAIEYLGWGTGNTVVDKQYEYTGGGKFKNWDGKYDGATTIKKALARSRNIPALLTFKQTTNEQKLKMAEDLGWTLETSSGTILETCSIGGFTGVTPLESAAAYATFARGGTYIEPYSFTKVVFTDTNEEFIVNPTKRQAMSEETAYLITDILRYAVTNKEVGGITNKSGTDIASKTGTSTVDSTTIKRLGLKGAIDGDVWQVAYTQHTVVSLWYSYPQLTSEHYLTSAEGVKARRELTLLLTKGLFNNNEGAFNKPSGITTATVELGTDPLQLASEYTPSDLKSTETFNKNSVPTETSKRFAKLGDASGLKAESSGMSTTLTWKEAPYPDAISESWIREYFTKSSIYSYWANEFISERIAYNNSNIGEFGYQVYMTDGSGTHDLGFTKETSFTYNGFVAPGTTFTVKASYSIFKANQSNGISVGVQGTQQSGISLTLPSCLTINNLYMSTLKSVPGVSVKYNGQDVTASTTLSLACNQNDCVKDGATVKIKATHPQYGTAEQSTTVKNSC